MRISTYQHANWTKTELSKVQARTEQHQQQVATGKKHLRMSEAPLETGKALAVAHSIRGVEQMQKDLADAKEIMITKETALSGIQKALERANVLALESTNGTKTAQDRQAAAAEIDGLIQQAAHLANTQHEGRYLFGGKETGQPPFAADGTYSGSKEGVSWKLSDSYSIEVVQDGSSVLTPALQTLTELSKALKSGAPAETMQGLIQQNNSNMDEVLNMTTKVGSSMSTMETFNDILSEQKIGLEERRSAIQDVDMMEAISDLSLANSTYQATLQAVSMMNKISILNYM